jgi:predicted nucleotidyltransferase
METVAALKPIEIDEAEWAEKLSRELARFVDYVKEHFEPSRIVLFGSMAAGQPRLWSDIDLVIVRETEKNFIDRGLEIQRGFDTMVGIDLLVYTPEEFNRLSRERPFILQEIAEKGRVLFERE